MALSDTSNNKHGRRTRAGQLLSQFLREIAEEKTEMIKNKDGEDVMASKAEALGRLMWKMAFGYQEIRVEDDGTKTTINHPPDRSMIGLIYDRIEGRVPQMTEMGKKRTVADRVSEQGRKRIEEAGQAKTG